MKALIFTTIFFLLSPLFAAVVRPAPDFQWDGVGGRLSRLRGQPVVLLIAPSPDSRAFKKQAKNLKEIYANFASRKTVFVAAFTQRDGRIRSDIPFVVLANGERVAADYGVRDGFRIVLIGKDGNVDLQTSKVIPASRVREVMTSSFAVQAPGRKL